jgi:hypothetical protein
MRPMEFHFEVDAAVDEERFNTDLESGQNQNSFPPFHASWSGNSLTVSVNSPNMPESSVRQIVKLALGRQGRRLKD